MSSDGLFKFNIGDLVAHRLHPNRATVVVERLIQECHGGRQVKYLVRDSLPSTYAQERSFVEVTEPELVAAGRLFCEGCGWGIPLVDAPGMAGGKAHVDEHSRSACAHIIGHVV